MNEHNITSVSLFHASLEIRFSTFAIGTLLGCGNFSSAIHSRVCLQRFAFVDSVHSLETRTPPQITLQFFCGMRRSSYSTTIQG